MSLFSLPGTQTQTVCGVPRWIVFYLKGRSGKLFYSFLCILKIKLLWEKGSKSCNCSKVINAMQRWEIMTTTTTWQKHNSEHISCLKLLMRYSGELTLATQCWEFTVSCGTDSKKGPMFGRPLVACLHGNQGCGCLHLYLTLTVNGRGRLK